MLFFRSGRAEHLTDGVTPVQYSKRRAYARDLFSQVDRSRNEQPLSWAELGQRWSWWGWIARTHAWAGLGRKQPLTWAFALLEQGSGLGCPGMGWTVVWKPV